MLRDFRSSKQIDEDDGCCGATEYICTFTSFWEWFFSDYDCADNYFITVDGHLTVGDRLQNWKERRIETKRLNRMKKVG